MAPSLIEVMSMRIHRSKEDLLFFNNTKGNAQRFISPLTGGYLKGDDFTAEFVQGGSDWLRFDPTTEAAHLDARLQFRQKQDGALFYVHFTGLVRFDDLIRPLMSWSPEAKTTRSQDHYNFTSPIFEVSEEKYKWMEQTAFVGHGHYVVFEDGEQAVEYEIYKLVTG